LGVRTLMLEGNGRINVAALRARPIDQVSILDGPMVDGRGRPTPFEFDLDYTARRRLALHAGERRADDFHLSPYDVEGRGA
jgi:riboflavin biosynthesis pyrimidine reductase